MGGGGGGGGRGGGRGGGYNLRPPCVLVLSGYMIRGAGRVLDKKREVRFVFKRRVCVVPVLSPSDESLKSVMVAGAEHKHDRVLEIIL